MPTEANLALTQLLNRFAAGDLTAESELVPYIYAELHKMAASKLRNERPGHTLQPTALVNEAYLRLAGRKAKWKGREHFFAVAAHIMRDVLVDYARRRNAHKRGEGVRPVGLEEGFAITSENCELVLIVDEALDKLAQLDARLAKVVEMRYFAGMTEEEIALVLGRSSKTIKRDWTTAKAWLAEELSVHERQRV